MCTLIAGCLWALAACEPDVVRPGAEPVFVQAGQQAEVDLLPDADTYVSRTEPETNFGTDTILRLDGDRRPLLRWDSLTLAEAVGGDSLVEARLELQVLANGQGWGTVGRRVGVHGMSGAWEETEAFWGGCDACDASFCICHDWHMDDPRALIRETDEGYESYWDPWNREATDSLVVTNGDDGVVAFDVTADVLGVLTGGPYRQGWLLKKEDESAGGAVDFGSRESGSPPRLVLTLASGDTVPQVPAVAPDTVPAGFYDEENIRTRVACMSRPMLKGILVVTFRANTTQAERQEAIDLVQGEVVGGISVPEGEGYYYVRVEDDEEGQIVCDAREALNGLPQVSLATLATFSEPDYRRPHEGDGEWQKSAWIVNPDAVVASERWGLEAIAGPLAWGCETGSQSTPVAVVDAGFQHVPDVMENVLPQWRGDVGVNLSTDHGTKVASVLAARGDNNKGITGTMWRADLRPYDVTVADGTVVGSSDAGIVAAIRRAASDGARVINLSLGIRWGAVEPDPFSEDDHYDVLQKRDRLVEALEGMEDPPLLVLSAGNDGVSAYWNGWTAAGAVVPEHILVVGASTLGNDLWEDSNHGELVDIVAPGASVAVLDHEGEVDEGFGTSFAAPHAAGVAGLLMSFDTLVTPSDARQLIVEGAIQGGRLVPAPSPPGNIFLLNAYESLRAAAATPGAPLCGNRVWAADGQIVAQRDRELDTREVLYDSGGDLTNVHVFHGGRRIELRDSSVPGNPALAYDPVSREWPTTTEPATTKPGGTLRSWEGTSHDGDRFLEVTRQEGASQDTYTVRVSDAAGTSEPVTVSVPLSQATSLTCVHTRDGECVRTVVTGRRESTVARSGLSPMGDWAAVAVNLHVTRTLSVSPFSVCPFPPADEDEPELCREVHSERTTSGSRMFRADLQSLQPTQIGELADALSYVGVSEDGEEFVSGERSSRQTSTFRALENGVWTTVSDPQEHTNCQIAYRSSASPTDARLLIPSPDVCSIAWTGTVSPERGVGDIELTSR